MLKSHQRQGRHWETLNISFVEIFYFQGQFQLIRKDLDQNKPLCPVFFLLKLSINCRALSLSQQFPANTRPESTPEDTGGHTGSLSTNVTQSTTSYFYQSDKLFRKSSIKLEKCWPDDGSTRNLRSEFGERDSPVGVVFVIRPDHWEIVLHGTGLHTIIHVRETKQYRQILTRTSLGVLHTTPHYCGTYCVEMVFLFPAPLSISVCWGPDRVAAQSTYAVTLESWETTKWNLCSLSLQFRNSNISHSSSLTPWQLLVNLKYFYTTFIVIRQLLEFVKITDIVSRIPRNWGTEGEWERDQMSRFIAVCLP